MPVTTPITANNLEITKERVKEWSACTGGYRWFLEQFPQGGQFVPVYRALRAAGRADDANWLVGKISPELDPVLRVAQIAQVVGADHDWVAEQVQEVIKAADKDVATGDEGHAAATGYKGHAAATGYKGHAAATGDEGHAAATGDEGHAAATGDEGHAAATGEHAIAAALGMASKAMAGEKGAIVLAHFNDDGELVHIRASKVGENGVAAGKWYLLGAEGQFVECEE
ncbi:hypothetical protein [Delftia acidovorans]|uniref:hypothetical protein n=1 Tax=Delftia acidovorans TaxID=80866 RepID=UPI0030EC4F27